MVAETTAWLAIGLMFLVVLFTRVAGVTMAAWMPSTPFWQRFFKFLPGTLLISISVPSFLSSEWAIVVASALVLGLAMLRVNLVVTMIVGVISVALMRAWF